IDLDNDGVVDPKKDLDKDGKYEIPAEDGIAYPAQLLLANGYKFLYQQNGDISILVNKILEQAKAKP
ncbi:MAG: hypothetical protein WAK14_08440, partial [Methanobacterium sp.]